MRTWQNIVLRCLAIFLCLAISPATSSAYSVLTHEQVVDLLWKDQIQPLLLRRFPHATPDDLRKAHAYAYGGCVLQDMGYYPFGNKFFSDLVHYVRSGDFVEHLLKDSSDLNEYAFALGALTHYAADNSGHPAINHIVAIEFPKLKKKYGNVVTYAQDPKAHIRTEFGFDMVQVAKNRYTSDRYHDMVGFEVSKPLLERAFQETYNLKLSDVFGDEDLAIGSFRRAISIVIPEMTRVALLSRHDVIVKDTPNFDRQKFLYHLSRSNYEHEWGTVYRKPGLGSRILAFFLKIVPKVGPFKAVDFKIPSQQTEDIYIKSVNTTIDDCDGLFRDVRARKLDLANTDYDTGKPTKPGEYPLSDKTYARLVDELSTKAEAGPDHDLRANLLSFYSDSQAPLVTRKNAKAWKKLQQQLEKLKASGTDEPASSAEAVHNNH
ncbi:MAG TPA: zinc dependent phospholipase C family protein [Terriglobales bacterium]|nr:zinc dependent phospholipase C family protein [Terriglobales bacterium]